MMNIFKVTVAHFGFEVFKLLTIALSERVYKELNIQFCWFDMQM